MRRSHRDDGVAALLARVAGLRQESAAAPPRKPRDPRPRRVRDLHALAASIGTVEEHARFVVVELTVDVLAKIPEAQADDYLHLKDGVGRVHDRVAEHHWTATNVVSGSDAERVAELPRTFGGPELRLRSYDGVVCAPRSCLTRDHVVLPDSFRMHPDRRLRTSALVDWHEHFSRRPSWTPAPLAGTYFHLDNEWRGHFGHALVEQMSKVWAWQRAKAIAPDVRALMFRGPTTPVAEWEYDLWAAAGISRREIVVVDRPVTVETLFTASPAYTIPSVLHPQLRATMADVGRAMAARAPQREWPARVFLSRRSTHERWCHNAADVESLMRRYGFQVIYPQDHSLPEQFGLVRQAEVVAGFSGSGMYQVGYTETPAHVISIRSESYTGLGEVRLAALAGHRLDVVWCRSDVRPGTASSRAAFKADFTFDPDREGRFLLEVLDGLPAQNV